LKSSSVPLARRVTPRVDIRLHQRATGDRPGSAVLNRPLGRHEHQTSRASLVAGDEFEPGDTVAVVRLDDGLADVARLRLLKIDVEGFEAAVLRGARQVLRRCDAVLIEINPTALHRAGSEPGEVIALLEQQQLWPHRVDADGKLVRTNRVQVATEFEDLVFVRQP
jgi:FkbM family methyltransferase